MAATALDTIRIYCKAKESTDSYEADVVPDLAVTELIAGLNEVSYLPALAAGDRWHVLHRAANTEIPPNGKLVDYEVQDGDQLRLRARLTRGRG